MRSLSASDSALVIQVPAWIGLLSIALAVVLAILVFVLKRPRPVRFAAFLGVFVLLYFGWFALRTVTTLEARGFYIESMYGEEERIGWSQVSSVDGAGAPAAKGPKGAKGAPAVPADQLAFSLRSGGEVSIDLSGLSDEEKARVVAFVRERIKR